MSPHLPLARARTPDGRTDVILEPLTHFLFGGVLARAGLNRKSALATVTLVLASEAPDLDVFSRLGGPIAGFAHHRGLTHTFIGIPFVAALVVSAVYLGYRCFGRRCGDASKPQPRWGVLFGLALLAGAFHILLDFTNSYGVRPFEPFSYRWYSWDIVFIVEPVLWFILISGLLLPSLLGLVADEVRSGHRVRTRRGRTAAILALVLVAVFWGFRDYQHRRAVAALEALTYHAEVPLRVSAFPYYVNPFRWYGVVETESFYDSMMVDSRTPEVAPDGRATIRYKTEVSPVVLAADRSYLGRVFLDWARYPVTEVEQSTAPAGGYIVRFYDLRFQYPDSDRHPLEGWVQFDTKLGVVGQGFGIRGAPR